MARVSLTDILSIPDILSPDAFYLAITQVPGSGGDLRNLALKCLNCSIAGFSTEKITVPIHSHQRNFRGRGIQPQTLSVTYYEDQTHDTWKIVKGWKEFMVGTISGNSQDFLKGYSTSATLEIYDHTGNTIHTMTFYNVFPTDVGDIAIDGSSSSAMQIPVTFSYDYTESDIVQNLQQKPKESVFFLREIRLLF